MYSARSELINARPASQHTCENHGRAQGEKIQEHVVVKPSAARGGLARSTAPSTRRCTRRSQECADGRAPKLPALWRALALAARGGAASEGCADCLACHMDALAHLHTCRARNRRGC